MITSKECQARYGDPRKEGGMVVWPTPTALHVGKIPGKVYCNKDLVEPLRKALTNVVARDLVAEIKTWDGCFCIRGKVGGTSSSLHSWGVAIDINAATNGFNKKPTMSKALVACFTDAGLEWGGTWSKPDGMHFQLAQFPS